MAALKRVSPRTVKTASKALARPTMVLRVTNRFVVIDSIGAQSVIGIIFPVGVYIGMIKS